MVLIPIVLGCLYFSRAEFSFLGDYQSKMGWIAGWIFVLASITDFFDGYIARKRGIVTVFGSFIDPIADKFLVVSSMIMLQSLDRIPAIIVIILVLREMYMTSLRLLAQTEGLSVPVSQLGKWKTATQMVAVPFLMVSEQWHFIDFSLWGLIFLYLSAFLSLFSAIKYSLGLIQKLKADRTQKRLDRKLKKQQKKQEEN